MLKCTSGSGPITIRASQVFQEKVMNSRGTRTWQNKCSLESRVRTSFSDC